MINNIQLRLSILEDECRRLEQELKGLPRAEEYERGLKSGQMIAFKAERENLLDLLKEAQYRKENGMDRFVAGPDYRLGGAYSPDPDCTADAVDKAYEFIYQFHEQHGYAPNAEFVGESTEVHQDQVQEAFDTWNKEEDLEKQKNKVYLREVG